MNPLDTKFNVAPATIIDIDGGSIAPHGEENEMVDQDYSHARGNLYGIIEKGNVALTNALELAMTSEDPEAYDVVSKLIKQVAAVNSQLLEIAERKNKAKVRPAASTGVTTSTNNTAIFVGSTTELNHMISKLKG